MKETKWIIATATVIIVMVSMVFSVSDNIASSYQQAIGDMLLPFDVILDCESEEEVEQVLTLAGQQDKNIISTVSRGSFYFGIPQSDFNLEVLAASESLVEIFNIDVLEGYFPQNTDEIMLDNKINQVSGQEYRIGDSIIIEAVVPDTGERKVQELKVVGFFDTVNGSGFTLYGYMNEEAGIQFSSLLEMPESRRVILKLSKCSWEAMNDLVICFLPEY